jgi:hypothetical protein
LPRHRCESLHDGRTLFPAASGKIDPRPQIGPGDALLDADGSTQHAHDAPHDLAVDVGLLLDALEAGLASLADTLKLGPDQPAALGDEPDGDAFSCHR